MSPSGTSGTPIINHGGEKVDERARGKAWLDTLQLQSRWWKPSRRTQISFGLQRRRRLLIYFWDVLLLSFIWMQQIHSKVGFLHLEFDTCSLVQGACLRPKIMCAWDRDPHWDPFLCNEYKMAQRRGRSICAKDPTIMFLSLLWKTHDGLHLKSGPFEAFPLFLYFLATDIFNIQVNNTFDIIIWGIIFIWYLIMQGYWTPLCLHTIGILV